MQTSHSILDESSRARDGASIRPRTPFRWFTRASAAAAAGMVAVGSSVASAAAGPRDGLPPFTEEAQLRGLSYVPAQDLHFGDGVAMADLDNDGDLDIVVLGAANMTIGVFQNQGNGTFIDRSGGISGLNPWCSGVTAVDVDRDGDLDLHVTRRDGLPDRLYLNLGNFSFTDRATALGVAHTGDNHGAAWADVNGDGWLDLYVCDRDGSNALYIAQPPRPGALITFVDQAAAWGVAAGNSPSFAAGFLDMDDDGDPDLYLANDHGLGCSFFRNHLFRNDGGVFTDVTDDGTEACLNAMCVAIGDFDGDARQDLFSTNTPQGHALMLNGGDRPWTRAEDEAGVAGHAVGWGASFFDFDHDGRLDLYVCHADTTNRLFRNTAAWPTEDVSSAMAVADPAEAYGCAVGDVDGDGDPDLLVSARDVPIRLFINHAGQQRRWIGFDVVGLGPAPAVSGRAPASAVGTVVHVETAAGVQVREVRAGTGFKSQDDMRLHVGLDDAPAADEIRVRWPHGGGERVLRHYPSDHRWTIWPTERMGDLNHDGVRDAADLALMADCWTGDGPGSLGIGCELADLDGDADVDAADVLALLEAGYEGWTGDCDEDGVIDAVAIASGVVVDADGDGVPDGCPATPGMPADLDGDGRVDGADVQVLLQHWGGAEPAIDLDGSGSVAMGDLLLVLAAWTG